jgi:hypothetical protein
MSDMPGRGRGTMLRTMEHGEVAWHLHCQGWSWERISRYFKDDPDRPNLARQDVGEIIHDWRDNHVREDDRAEIRKAVMSGVMHMLSQASELMDSEPVPAYSNGRPILMPDGTPAEDHSGRIAAMNTALKVYDRIARMVGLDAPSQVDVHISAAAQEQAEVAAREALARVFSVVEPDGSLRQIEGELDEE